ncbi:MAG TPA: AAA family ATPase [Candidatus Saccharimonadales bacterium]|nr:AAA family ATPase [Candidatus Saccharimonadales bacterium]
MTGGGLDLHSLRARKARAARRLTNGFFGLCMSAAVVLTAAAIGLYAAMPGMQRVAYLSAAVALGCFMLAMWYRGDLARLPITGKGLDERLGADVLAALPPGQPLSPQVAWHALKRHWQLLFFTNHLLLPVDAIEQQLSSDEAALPAMWQEAARLADLTDCPAIEPGHVAAAALRTSPVMQQILTQLKSSPQDVEQLAVWLGRILEAMRTPRPYFGGIGRDWASGFTPFLNRYGENVSLAIEHHGAHFGALMDAPSVRAMRDALAQGAPAVALIGDSGAGKTSHVYALAQSLLQEDHDRRLEHKQIVALNPSLILSAAQQPGVLERTVMTLLQEAVHAGNIILFLDDAQLFFRSGVGSFDMTQVLLPIVQGRSVQLVLAMSPRDYQQLKATNGSFAGLLSPVVLGEPAEPDVLRVLEDTATGFEGQHRVLIAYEALREAYRLSSRYDQDTAMPGKAIRLLEQALTHAQQGIVTAASVQAAIEQTRGVKVGTAAPAEASELLHLEDAIHQRMINQSRAVSVVANALRRARAGVANPRRPIGSFLFLGPTGVGKTELAKAIAATYFGAESNMIRLDMSEYQQVSDVSRLLSAGGDEEKSLLLAIRQQPFRVVLLDEIEKAHPNILNLLLQLLDEGQLTDTSGRPASFKDAVIIATSNAGANTIRERVEKGEELASFEKQFEDELINSGQFKPELLNRFDEIVLFRPLKPDELVQVVQLMMQEVNATLANQNISVELTPSAAQKIVAAGYDPRLGARPMRRALQRAVEDSIAARILSGQTKPGDHVVLDAPDIITGETAA